jgi:DNA topoisomerase-1
LEFKPKLEKDVIKANKEMPDPIPQEVGRSCPTCGAPLIFRTSKRTGQQFIGCSTFPKCRYIEFPNSPKPELLDEKCPLCDKQLLRRLNKREQPFIGCSGYPKCKYMKKINPDGTTTEVDPNKQKFIKKGKRNVNNRIKK